MNEKQKIKTKMIDLNLNISIIILNVNGLHTSIKKQRLSKWSFKKSCSPLCAFHEKLTSHIMI